MSLFGPGVIKIYNQCISVSVASSRFEGVKVWLWMFILP